MTPYNDLANYLKLMLQQGKSKEQITQTLKSACWPEEIIEQQFAQLSESQKNLWRQPSWPVSAHTWNSPVNTKPIIKTVDSQQTSSSEALPSASEENHLKKQIPLPKSKLTNTDVLVSQALPTKKTLITKSNKKIVSHPQIITLINNQPAHTPTTAKQTSNINTNSSTSNQAFKLTPKAVLAHQNNPVTQTTVINQPNLHQQTKIIPVSKKTQPVNKAQFATHQPPAKPANTLTDKTVSSILLNKIINKYQLQEQPLPKSIRLTKQKEKDFDQQQFKGIIFGLFLCLVALLALSWQLLAR